MKKLIIPLLLLSFSSGEAQAALLEINVNQEGNNVVFNGSGIIDLTGLGSPSSNNLDVSRSQFNLFGGLSGTSDTYSITIPTFVPLNNGFFNFDVITGDNFFAQGLNGNNADQGFLGLNSGYISETPIEFTWTVENQTIDTLALNFGTVAEFGNNTVNLTNKPSVPVPEPLTFLGVGTAMVFGMSFKRKLHKIKKK